MKKIIILVLTISVIMTVGSSCSSLQAIRSEGMYIEIDEVLSGMGVPWAIAFLSPEVIIFTEREGNIKTFDLQSGVVTVLEGVPTVWAKGQGGMLDVAVPDGFKSGDWVYFTYSKEVGEKAATALARAHVQNGVLEDWQDMLVTKSATSTGRHFGSRIAFDNKGHLYFSVGERGGRANGQDLQTHAGSILRLHVDGTVPTDNPFIESGGLPEIWSYGHRNPQGLVYDSIHNRLWANEHGPRGGDEINLIESGKNYGWPIVSHGKEYSSPVPVGEATEKEGMTNGVKVYIPSIAPGSLLLYSGKAFPGWQGNLFSGALALQHLNRIVLDSGGRVVKEERLLENMEERIRALVESPDGYLYFSTDSGKIFRLRPKKSGI